MDSVPWWLRAYLLFAAVQGLGIGLTGLLLPSEMQIPLQISPLNARFVAALYSAGGLGVLFGAFARRRAETRLFVLSFAFATTLILVLTIAHWSEFMADPLPHRPVWLFDYIADPVLGILVIAAARLLPPGKSSRHRLSSLLTVEAVVFGVLGLALLVVPTAMASVWPWMLPPVLGQLYACFFLTFALGAALAARLGTEPRAVSWFVWSTLTLAVLVLVASLLHLDRFKAAPVTYVWFVAFGLAGVAFAIAIRSSRRTVAASELARA